MKLKDACSLEEKLWQKKKKEKKSCDKRRQYIKKQRHNFADKGLSGQSYGFSSSHVWMWELDYKEILSAEELMLLNCGAGEDSKESLGLQGEQTSQY